MVRRVITAEEFFRAQVWVDGHVFVRLKRLMDDGNLPKDRIGLIQLWDRCHMGCYPYRKVVRFERREWPRLPRKHS
jgi:hypothetical protein